MAQCLTLLNGLALSTRAGAAAQSLKAMFLAKALPLKEAAAGNLDSPAGRELQVRHNSTDVGCCDCTWCVSAGLHLA